MAIASKKVKSRKDQYLKLISQFELQKLQNEDDYNQAFNLLRDVAGTKQLDKGSRRYFEVLVDLITDYEKRSPHRIDLSDLNPGEIVKHLAEENGMTLTALADEIGIAQSNLSEMINGKREWSKKTIVALHDRFLLDPMLFLASA